MVRIITDSAADFESQELALLNITCIPLVVSFGEESYQDGVELNKAQFYEKLLGGDVFPQTAQPSPALLEDVFVPSE